MRRSRSALLTLPLALALAIGLLLTPLSVAAADPTVRADLNLREGPGLDYAVLAVIPFGTAVTVAGDPADGWTPVLYGDLAGWVITDGLVFDGGQASPTPAPPPTPGATVAVAAVNLRTGPGLGFDVIAVLQYGDALDIVGGPEESDGYTWLQVSITDVGLGWVAGEFLEGGGSTASTEVVDAALP